MAKCLYLYLKRNLPLFFFLVYLRYLKIEKKKYDGLAVGMDIQKSEKVAITNDPPTILDIVTSPTSITPIPQHSVMAKVNTG